MLEGGVGISSLVNESKCETGCFCETEPNGCLVTRRLRVYLSAPCVPIKYKYPENCFIGYYSSRELKKYSALRFWVNGELCGSL